MKLFLKKISIIIIFLAVAGTITEHTLRKIPCDTSFKHNYILDHRNDIELLVMGSSLQYFGINPHLMEMRAFNGAIPGWRPELFIAQSIQVMDSMPALRALVVDLTFYSLNTPPISSHKPSHRLLTNANVYCHLCLSSKPLHNILIAQHHICESGRVVLRTFFRKSYSLVQCDAAGFNDREGRYDLFSSDKKRSLCTDNMKDNLDGLVADTSHSTSLYRRLARHCQRNSVRLFIVTMPNTSDYWRKVDPELLLQMRTFGKKMEQDYPNVSYLDFSKSTLFPDSLFYDPNHLNSHGAQVFTPILDSIIMSKLAS